MRKTPAKTATREATTTTTRKRRLSNVKARAGETLTTAEENTLRMHHGMETGLHAPLPSNAVNSALRAYLLEIEKRAYEATGRHLQDLDGDDEDEAPSNGNNTKEKIVSRLKSR